MKRLALLLTILMLTAVGAMGQARTASQLQNSPFSALDAGNPPLGSVRFCLNCKRQNGPCEAAGVGETPIGSDALKTTDGWMCSSRAAGAGSATVSSVSVGNLAPLFTSSVATATTTPAITFSFSTQTAKMFLAGPLSGSPAAPTFRGIAAGDFITGTVTNSRCLRVDGSGNVVVATADCGAGGGGGAWGSITGTLADQTDLQTALNLKAPLASPTFTGVPAAPTAAADTSTTQIATTAFVVTQAYAKLASPTFTGTPTLPTGTIAVTQSAGDSSTKVATTAFVTTADNLKANLASPTFTGTVTIPTPFTLGAVSVLPTGTELNFVDGVTSAIQTQLDAKQAGDADLAAIAGLSPSNDDVIQRKAGAWTNRTMAQLKTDLAINNVDNTSDANKPISTATQTALDAKITGPASATDNAIARFDLTTGEVAQNSPITLADNGALDLSTTQSSSTSITFNNFRPIVTLTAAAQSLYSGYFDVRLRGVENQTQIVGARIDGTNESTAGILTNLTGIVVNPFTKEAGASVTNLRAIFSAPDVESPTTNTYGIHHVPYFWRPGGTFTNHYGVYLSNPTVDAGTLVNNYGLYVASHTSGGTLNYNIFSAGVGSNNFFEGNITANSFIGGGTGAGYVELPQGSAPSLGTTSVQIAAPAAVTSYQFLLPGSSATGFLYGTNAANVNTLTFRTAAFSDLSGSATDAQIPNNITVDLATVATTANAGDSATAFFSAGAIEAARGGTGLGAPAEDQVLVGNGTGYDFKTLPSCSNATNDKLLYNSTTNTWSCGTDQTTGGGSGITALNTLTPATQTLSKTDDTNLGLTITSAGSDHNFTLTWLSTLADARVADDITLTNITQITNRAISNTTGDLAASRVDDGAVAATQALFSGAGAAAGFRAIADADVPNTITVDLATVATTATTAEAGDSATSFFSSGTVEAARLPDAVADGATKGVASFTAADFNATTGNISLDYSNGQAASGSLKGFLTSADWTTFNAKVGASTTDTLTNKTLDTEGTGNAFTSTHKFWAAAAGCANATAASFWDLGTSLSPTPVCKNSSSGTAQNAALDFPDSDGMYFAQFNVMLPEDFTGAVDAKIKWMAAATSGDVIWNVSTICVADGEVDNPSFNTASTVTDTAKGTTLQTNDAAITGVTITGCAAGELMHVKISRDRTTSGDTITGVVSFMGAQLTVRRAQ